MAFDGIVTKHIACELQNLKGARIDKIFQPNSNLILIGLYLNHTNYCLLINTDSKYYRMNLTTHSYENPKKAPNFCMVLRKHLLGLHLKNVIVSGLERIITIELEGLDDFDDIVDKKLIIELMGKHCNIIILNDENKIIDSLRHINNENSTHIIVPHISYSYPSISKKNFINCSSFDEFLQDINYSQFESNNSLTIDFIIDEIIKQYNGISKNQVLKLIPTNNLDISYMDSLNNFLEFVYTKLKKLVFCENTNSLTLIGTEKDYSLEHNTANHNNPDNYKDSNLFKLNFELDDYYYKKETYESLIVKKSNLSKKISSYLSKYKKRLLNINKKLEETNSMDKYRIYGELITANLYKIPKSKVNSVTLENYYNNNLPLEISLDMKYTPQENAKKFFKKYNKLKNTIDICSKQKLETENEINYLESILFEIDSSNTLDNLLDIEFEINEIFYNSDSSEFKTAKNSNKKKSSRNSNKSFSPLKYDIDGYTLLIGKNNKENDYLTLKYANNSDLWLHTKDIHGSHGILQLNKENIDEFKSTKRHIILSAAQIVAKHSKAKNSENVPVDFCLVKYVKKPNSSKPGMVIYSNQTTIYVTPQ